MKILIIEDEKKVALALKKGLTAEQYDVDAAFSGEDGFYLLNAQKFDLVILDLMLPKRDGLEILSQARQNPGVDPDGQRPRRGPGHRLGFRGR